jgi:methylase of polypeptide subunit release factors/nucleoside 2-deoxyribosyltransferase
MVAGPFSGLLRLDKDAGYLFEHEMRERIEEVHLTLRDAGYEVLSAHVAEQYGSKPWGDQFVERDLNWVSGCAAQVVLLPRCADGATMRTDGTMIELGFALACGKPIVLLAEDLDHAANSFFLRSLNRRQGLRTVEWQHGYGNRLLEALEGLLTEPSRRGRERSDVDGMLADLRKEQEPHDVLVGGLKLTVLPGVLSPRYSHSPDFLISKWHIPHNAKVLDLGCGCGVLGLAALREGAGTLLALDINEQAVANTELNFRRLGYSDRAEVRRSNVYEAIEPKRRFDIILLAAPYWDRHPKDDLERSCFDQGYQFFAAAIGDAHAHLSHNGSMYVLFSDQGDVARAVRIINEAGMVISEMHISRASPPAEHVRILWKLTPSRVSVRGWPIV